MKSVISLLASIFITVSAQASDRDCTCRGQTLRGKDITIVYNGRDGENNMAEAHVQIKVENTAMKYYKNLKVYLLDSVVGQRYAVKGPQFSLVLNIPAVLNVGDQFTAQYTYSNKYVTDESVTLNCKATQIR